MAHASGKLAAGDETKPKNLKTESRKTTERAGGSCSEPGGQAGATPGRRAHEAAGRKIKEVVVCPELNHFTALDLRDDFTRIAGAKTRAADWRSASVAKCDGWLGVIVPTPCSKLMRRRRRFTA